jgi:CubicO group peptidase (beta-lactamase class C family)
MLHPVLMRAGMVLALGLAGVVSASAGPLGSVLQAFVDNHTISGTVVLVASKERVLDLEAVGFSDLAAKAPMRTDALFWVASMSKPMTATAVMMLVDERKADLDAAVETYLPEFRGQRVEIRREGDLLTTGPVEHPATVRQILSHTAGLPFMSAVERKIDGHTLAEASISYGMTVLPNPPGKVYAYSNAGINSAGRLLEVISGKPYERFMEERLFKTLGMGDTVLRPSGGRLKRVAKSYKPDASGKGLQEIPVDQLTYPIENPGRGPSPAGGYFSTASDMGRFGRMILNGGQLDGRRYLSEASVRTMTSTQTGKLIDKENGHNGYGLGWSTTHEFEGGLPGPLPGACGHGGAYATQLWVDPQQGLVTVFMVQNAGFPGTEGPKLMPAFNKAVRETFGKK